MIFKKVLPSKEQIMYKCRKKGKITCSNDLSALKHLMLISQAPYRLLTGETIALNSKQLINVKKANCNHGVTGQPKEVTRVLSVCVTWCSKNLKIKTIVHPQNFPTCLLVLGQDTCLSCFQAISLSSVCSLNQWFGLHNDAGNAILG